MILLYLLASWAPFIAGVRARRVFVLSGVFEGWKFACQFMGAAIVVFGKSFTDGVGHLAADSNVSGRRLQKMSFEFPATLVCEVLSRKGQLLNTLAAGTFQNLTYTYGNQTT